MARSFTYAQKMKAVKLYLKCGSPTAVMIQLGYPGKSTLHKWVKAYQAGKDLHPSQTKNKSKYTAEQRKNAVRFYLENGKSISKTITALGYPGKSTLCEWLNQDVPSKNRKWFYKKDGDMVRCTQKQKEQAVIDYSTGALTPTEIAKELNISPYTIYRWKKKILSNDNKINTMKKQKSTSSDPEKLKLEIKGLAAQAEELRKQVYHLQLEKDVLEKAAELIKKDQGIILMELTNKEKTTVIDALRGKYRLKELLSVFRMAKSSYCYQKSILGKDKYSYKLVEIRRLFEGSKETYGYRRIYLDIKFSGKILSEKVIRKLMKEEGLKVRTIKRKKYSSYMGKISPAVENIINRDFHAERPNQKWVTDITEFHIPAGKIYLSPMIDCFDGLPITWAIGTHPDAELVNTMLDDAIMTLKEDEKPLVHSDRGAHYRWPGWINRMNDAGLTRSMSKKGCSPDNSACEGFFRHLKNEMFYERDWRNVSM